MNPLTGELPLHPALVHLPLGLSAAMPLVGLVLIIGRRWWPPSTAWVAVLLQAMILGGAIAAEETGEEDEEAAEERGVSEEAIHHHEELAEQFIGLSGVTLLAWLGGAALGARKAAPMLLGLASALSLGVAIQGARTGHAGGELVFGGQAATAGGEGAEEEERGEEEEEGRRRRRGRGGGDD